MQIQAGSGRGETTSRPQDDRNLDSKQRGTWLSRVPFVKLRSISGHQKRISPVRPTETAS